jgi:iron complex outermembrane recepter protein
MKQIRPIVFSALLMTGISAPALIWSSSAHAQASAPADEVADDGNAIVVTARRIEERLQDVPISVSAISAQDLARQNLDDLGDIAEKTVGFAFETFTGPLAQPVIRGQTNLRLTSPVQNVSTNLNGVYIQRGYFVDQGLLDLERVEVIKGPQSALYGRNAFAGAISLVARGANVDAGLTGRFSGTVGSDKRYEAKGGINVPIIPGTFAVFAAGGYSTFDGTWVNNHPLANTIAPTTFSTGKLGGYRKESFQLGAQLKIGGVLTIDGLYIHTDRLIEQQPAYTISTISASTPINTLNASPTGTGAAGTIAGLQNRLWVGELVAGVVTYPGETRGPGLLSDPRAYGLRGPSDIFIAKARLDLGGPISLQYIYGRTIARIDARGSSPRDTAYITPGFGTIFDSSGTGSRFVSDSHEGRADFKFSSLTGFVGVNYTKSEDDESNSSEYGTVNSVDAPNALSLFPIGPGLPIPAAAGFFRRNTYIRRNESVFSAFGFVNWKASDALSITLEGRYTNEKLRATDLIAPDIVGGFSNGFIALVAPTATRSASFFTPRGSITYKFSDDHNVYLSAARGYKSGGINGIAASFNRNSTVAGVVVTDVITPGQAIPAPRAGATAVSFLQTSTGSTGLSALQATYAAETNWTYEIGSKNQFFDGKMTLNLAAYYTSWKNLQSNAVRLQPDGTAPTSFAFLVPSLIGNLGDVGVYGFELEGNYKFTPELKLDFGASYNHARYKDGVFSQRFGAAGNCDGIVCKAIAVPGSTYPQLSISGNQLERTPAFEALLGLNYDTEFSNGWGFDARIDVTYQSKQFVDEANLAFVPSRTLVNASLGLDIKGVRMQAWVKNLFDKKYVTSALLLVGTGGAGTASYVPILGEQRTMGISASYKF